jgi:hypothetical protein
MAQSPGKRSLVRADFFLGQCPKFLARRSQVRAGFHIITFGRLRGFCDFIPDPHVIDKPSEQLCDGLLIEGDALIVMEYKQACSQLGQNTAETTFGYVTKLQRNWYEISRKRPVCNRCVTVTLLNCVPAFPSISDSFQRQNSKA